MVPVVVVIYVLYFYVQGRIEIKRAAAAFMHYYYPRICFITTQNNETTCGWRNNSKTSKQRQTDTKQTIVGSRGTGGVHALQAEKKIKFLRTTSGKGAYHTPRCSSFVIPGTFGGKLACSRNNSAFGRGLAFLYIHPYIPVFFRCLLRFDAEKHPHSEFHNRVTNLQLILPRTRVFSLWVTQPITSSVWNHEFSDLPPDVNRFSKNLKKKQVFVSFSH